MICKKRNHIYSKELTDAVNFGIIIVVTFLCLHHYPAIRQKFQTISAKSEIFIMVTLPTTSSYWNQKVSLLGGRVPFDSKMIAKAIIGSTFTCRKEKGKGCVLPV